MITIMCDLTIAKDIIHRRVGGLQTVHTSPSEELGGPLQAGRNTGDWKVREGESDSHSSLAPLTIPGRRPGFYGSEGVDLIDLLTPQPNPHEDSELTEASNLSLQGSVGSSLCDSEHLMDPLEIPQASSAVSQVMDTTEQHNVLYKRPPKSQSRALTTTTPLDARLNEDGADKLVEDGSR